MWLVKTSGSPYWYARWDHPGGLTRPDGRPLIVSRSTGEVGKRAAEARGAELEAADRAAWDKEQAGGRVSAARVIEEYWDTEASKRKAAKGHVFPHLARIAQFLGDRPYCDVTIADVARFADSLNGHVSDSTINRALSVWRRMHNVAGKRRLYPVQMIDWAQVRRDEPMPIARQLTQEQVGDLLSRLPPHAQHIAIFALATGARRSQVLSLTWDRVDIADRSAVVWRKHRKANAPHRIELNQSALAVLAERQALGSGEGPVFDTTNFRKLWDAAIAGAGLDGVRFHDLRHTFATLLAKRSLLATQRQLGHSDMRVTMRYAHAERSDVRDGVEAMPLLEVRK